jgi:hypothetical protein
MSAGSLSWEIARAGGLVAFALLSASVAMGLALSLGWRSPRWTRFVTNEVHRFVTLLALVFVVVHVTAIVLDPFIRMSLPDVLVPFLTSYRPVWVALGVIAGYLTLAIYLSERLRSRIGYAWWRRFHVLSFVAFGMVLVHGIATGSDTRSIWGLALYGGSLSLVVFLLLLRLFPAPPARTRPVAAIVAIVAVFGVVGFTMVGPLRPGWSARAGGTVPTGAATSGTASAGAAAAAGPVEIGVTVSSPLPFDGTLARHGTAFQVQGQTADGTGAFLVQLESGDDGGIASGQVVLNTGSGQVCQGAVGAVGDSTIDATCSTADGSTWSLRVAVTQASRSVISGTLEVTPATGGQPGSGGQPRPAGATESDEGSVFGQGSESDEDSRSDDDSASDDDSD